MLLFSPVEGWGIVLQCCSVWLVIMFGTELLWARCGAKVCLSPISSSCSIQSLSVFCYFFFGKLTYFVIFFFFSLLKWRLLGNCGVEYELWAGSPNTWFSNGLLGLLRYYQANDEWDGTAGIDVFWESSLLWILHSSILLSYGCFLHCSLKEWGRHLECRWKGPLPYHYYKCHCVLLSQCFGICSGEWQHLCVLAMSILVPAQPGIQRDLDLRGDSISKGLTSFLGCGTRVKGCTFFLHFVYLFCTL